MRARVTVYPRREVLDPQGKAISQALDRLGFDEVEDVRAGKSFDVTLATDDPAVARERLRQMCEKLLANTVVEDFHIEIPEAETAEEAVEESGAGDAESEEDSDGEGSDGEDDDGEES